MYVTDNVREKEKKKSHFWRMDKESDRNFSDQIKP